MIETRAVSVVAGGRQILQDLTLCVHPGEVLAIVGPNGAGKSTLLRVLSGELRPPSGTVWMDERMLSEWPPRQRALRLAVLPQQSRLDFGFLVEEVVLMGRTPHTAREGSERDLAVARAALSRVGMSHMGGRLYPTLSGGEQQRAQLARVLAQLTDCGRYLLLDEPVAGLDLNHQHAVMKVAVGVASEGVGVLVVLHDLRLARRYASRVVVMRDGRVVAMGSADKVLTASLIAAVYEVSADLATETIGIPFET